MRGGPNLRDWGLIMERGEELGESSATEIMGERNVGEVVNSVKCCREIKDDKD